MPHYKHRKGWMLMLYLPIKSEASNIFPKLSIAVRQGVRLTVSCGVFPDKTTRSSASSSPVFELSYTRKNPVFSMVNQVPVELRPGYALLGFLGETRCTSEYGSGEEISIYSIWVSPQSFDGFSEAVFGKNKAGFCSFQKGGYSCYSFKSDAREESIIHKLDDYFSKEDQRANRLLLESYILELLSINIQRLFSMDQEKDAKKPLSRTDVDSLADAREILLNRLDSPPTLLELSRMLHMNDCKLKRCFKQHFGKTVYEFIREQRLEKAFSLLEQGNCNVGESAFAVGYTNVSHFSKAFRKRFGIPPRVLIQ